MSKYVLFYSINCRHSQKFVELLKKYPTINSEFQKYSIESMATIPDGVRQTPSVWVKEEGAVHSGQEAFGWLKKAVSLECYDDGNGFAFLDGDKERDRTATSYSFISGAPAPKIDPNGFNPKNGQPNKSDKAPDLPPQLRPISIEESKKQAKQAVNLDDIEKQRNDMSFSNAPRR